VQTNGQELLHAASGRLRRGKKTTGRIVVSTLGFAIAYYFDTENGGLRRQRLRQKVQGLLRTLHDGLPPDAADDPPAVFHPLLGTPGVDEGARPAGRRAAAAR
jgi:hypothetical protein